MTSDQSTGMTLIDLLAHAGADNHAALIAPAYSPLSYGQLRENVAELAAQLAGFGIGHGERVAIAMNNVKKSSPSITKIQPLWR
ncbi:MAG TPA: hypothetical protein PKA05_05915 [Roseiflexaceae bacterium]|nr:hypothetical protein [Roseiflexaceae bacterium]